MRHPAKFSPAIVEAIRSTVEADHDYSGRTVTRVLDPFAGVGGIHAIRREPEILTLGVELEHEWAAMHEHNVQGDATNLNPSLYGLFDVIATSPAYGNRMADRYDGRDGSRRHTYRIDLGRPLSDGSGAGLQWGPEYRDLHEEVWCQADRCLKPGGMVILNVKNHVRHGKIQHVAEWHAGVFADLGYQCFAFQHVDTPHMRHGANADARCDELLFFLRKYGTA